jgi:hypothetical protein
MQNDWHDYVTTADDIYVSATEVDARIAELMQLLKSARAAMNGLDHNTDDIQLMNDIDAATKEQP